MKTAFKILLSLALLPIIAIAAWQLFFFKTLYARTPETVHITILDSHHVPVPHAKLFLRESGERLLLPVPVGGWWHHEHREMDTDAKGTAQTSFRESTLSLERVLVDGQELKIERYEDHLPTRTFAPVSNHPTWLLGYREIDSRIFVSRK
ncbi:MAG: hypothetical protein P4L99_06770 [Chthoniobacter sp.]|nr:hypothetical protein [Chthoniobacter sp.]